MAVRLKILLLLPHLGGGGAERVFELLAAYLPEHKYDVHLGLVTGNRDTGHGLPRSVTIHALDARRVRDGAARVVRLVRQLEPDVVLSNMAHLNFLVLLLRRLFPRGTRVLVRQNGTVSMMLRDLRRPRMTRTLYRLLYPLADAVLCQSTAMGRDLTIHTGVPSSRIAILPNPVDIDAIQTCAAESACRWSGPGPHLLYVGRLAPEKGVDLLLEAFASVLRRMPTANLTLAGVGSEGAHLREQARFLGLGETVRFLGYTPVPAAYYAGASLFVLPSRHEGMPNALLEAAAGGLPIVTTPASGGLLELVQGQPGVWLANDVSATALAETLAAALDAIHPGQRFEHAWIHAFGLDQAIARYQAVIDGAGDGTTDRELNSCMSRS